MNCWPPCSFCESTGKKLESKACGGCREIREGYVWEKEILFQWSGLLLICTLKPRKKFMNIVILKLYSVQFSCSVMSDSLQPHELQHARPLVHHQLPEFTQTHVHQVGDAIQPSHPPSSPSPPAVNLSQHQGLFKWVSSSHQVAKVLEFQLQHQSFQWTPRTDLL